PAQCRSASRPGRRRRRWELAARESSRPLRPRRAAGSLRPARSDRERQAGRVDALAEKQAALAVPREEDRDLPLEPLGARRDPEPLRLVRAAHIGFLADALRPDHDVAQLEVDVRECAEQAAVEARGTFVALPAMAGLDELVDA